MDEAQIQATIGRDPTMRDIIVNAAAVFAVDHETAAAYMVFGPDDLDDLDDDSDVVIFALNSDGDELDELLDLLQSLRPDIADQCRIRRYCRPKECR